MTCSLYKSHWSVVFFPQINGNAPGFGEKLSFQISVLSFFPLIRLYLDDVTEVSDEQL